MATYHMWVRIVTRMRYDRDTYEVRSCHVCETIVTHMRHDRIVQ